MASLILFFIQIQKMESVLFRTFDGFMYFSIKYKTNPER